MKYLWNKPRRETIDIIPQLISQVGLDRGQGHVHAQLMAKRTPNDPTIAIGYLRVSTEEQGLGLEAQRAAIEAWAVKAGVTVAAWHVDQGVSGSVSLEKRPGLMAALISIKEHKAGRLVAAKIDRVARAVAVGALVARAVQQAGANIISADGVGNGDEPADKFVRDIMTAAAELEVGLIRGRTKAALAAKKAKGERVGCIPFGYRVGEDGKTLVDDEEEKAIVDQIRELREQGVSPRAIARKLDELGMRSRAGTPLAATQVARVWQALRAAA